jgi:hypothetical protein
MLPPVMFSVPPPDTSKAAVLVPAPEPVRLPINDNVPADENVMLLLAVVVVCVTAAVKVAADPTPSDAVVTQLVVVAP